MKPKELRQTAEFKQLEAEIKELKQQLDEKLNQVSEMVDSEFSPCINLDDGISFHLLED